MNLILSNILIAILFSTVALLHLTKKTANISLLYGIQSLVIVISLIEFYFEKNEISLLLIAAINLIVKVVIAPIFFTKSVQKNKLVLSDGNILNIPITLISITAFLYLGFSPILSALANIIPANQNILSLSLSAIFVSLFLIINSKSELKQIAGILSLENSIVMFAMFAGLEQSFGLQIGIMFDIFVWIIISIILTSMIYEKVGSLDTNTINHLTD